jgi:hypothetical protein
LPLNGESGLLPLPYEQLRQKHVGEFAARLPEYVQRLDWPADRLRAERERRLRALIRIAQERSTWHRERLGGIDELEWDRDRREIVS